MKEPVQFSSVQFSSVQFSSVQFSSVQFSSVQFSSPSLRASAALWRTLKKLCQSAFVPLKNIKSCVLNNRYIYKVFIGSGSIRPGVSSRAASYSAPAILIDARRLKEELWRLNLKQ